MIAVSTLIGAGYEAYAVAGILDFPFESETGINFAKQEELKTYFILIRQGKRGHTDMIIDIRTGKIWAVNNIVSIKGIDFVWNQDNIWVCLHPDNISFDIHNKTLYEPVFKTDNLIVSNHSQAGFRRAQKSFFRNHPRLLDRLTDILDSDSIKSVLTNSRLLECYPECSESDGLSVRVTEYKDDQRYIPQRIIDIFASRTDFLCERTSDIVDCSVTDTFFPGRPDFLQSFCANGALSRRLKFFSGRKDGLIQLEHCFGSSIVQTFELRDDCLKKQEFLFGLDASATESLSLVRRFYETQTQKQWFSDPVRRLFPEISFDITNGRVLLTIDIGPDKLFSRQLCYNKENGVLQLNAGLCNCFEYLTDRHISEVQALEKLAIADFHSLWELENVIMDSRLNEEEIISRFRSRLPESENFDQSDALKMSIYHVAHQFSSSSQGETKGSTSSIQTEKAEEKKDLISSYLNEFGSRALNPYEADLVKTKIKSDFEGRCEQRRSMLKTRLAEQEDLLKKKRSQARPGSADHEFASFQRETSFNIAILKQTITRHDSTNLEKRQNLEILLATDSRLNFTH